VNDLVLLRPGIRYIFSTAARHARAISVQFRVETYPRAWGKPQTWPWQRALPEGDICRPLLTFLLAQAKRRDPTVIRPALTALIAAFVSGEMLTAAPSERPLPAQLLAIFAFIRNALAKEPHQRLRHRQIAAAGKISPSTLYTYFRKYVGAGPHVCIMRARLDRAVQLMQRTDLPIEQIAVLTGFCNQAHVWKWCNSEFGCNPHTLRLHLRDGEHPLPLPRCPLLAGPTFGHIPAYDPALAKPIPRRKGIMTRLSRLISGKPKRISRGI
jgi:AraC-like DNA-binding protein